MYCLYKKTYWPMLKAIALCLAALNVFNTIVPMNCKQSSPPIFTSLQGQTRLYLWDVQSQ